MILVGIGGDDAGGGSRFGSLVAGVAVVLRDIERGQGILGQGAPSAEFVGVSFPGGATYGDQANLKLRFDTTYVQMAADGAL